MTELTLSLGMHHRMRPEYGILSSLVENLYKFIESGKDPELVIEDRMNSQEVLAKDYFLHNRYYLIKADYLPADLSVKGAYFVEAGKHAEMPMLQLAPLDFERIKEDLEQSRLSGTDVNLKGKSVYMGDNELIFTRTYSMKIDGGYRTRSQLIFTLDRNNEDLRTNANTIIDSIYDNNMFVGEPHLAEVQAGARDLTPRMELRQDLRMQQALQGEQQLVQRPALIPYLRMQNAVAVLPHNQLVQRAEQVQGVISQLEEKAAKKTIEDAIAKIKETAPTLSWGEATNLFYKMCSKGSQ